MHIGKDKISHQQRALLEHALSAQAPHVLVEAFEQLLSDEDIREDREQIDPEWLRLFEEKKSFLLRIVPSAQFQPIVKFFENLGPFDQSLGELDPKSLKLTFLLGAGASKPAPSSIPTVKELLPELLERARRLDRDDVTKLADFCDGRKIDNIEDLLTAALATFSSRNPTVLRLINYLLYRGDSEDGFERVRPSGIRRFREPAADLSSVAFLQDTLQVLFGLLSSTMLPAKPNVAHEAIASYLKDHAGSTVVTTNYDCCMDLALGDVSKDFEYGIEFENVEAKNVSASAATRLVKLHGSLNWFYCETCQEAQLVDIRQMVTNFLEDKAPYPVIGICRGCGGQRRGLLVPPLAMKFDLAPPLTPLVSDAKGAFDAADLIVVVGFSFADADIYISRMLGKSMQTKTQQKLLIVDPDQSVVERVRRKFKASIPNFDTSRIIRMTGDCADGLPKFLKGQLTTKSAVPATTSESGDGNGSGHRRRKNTKSSEAKEDRP